MQPYTRVRAGREAPESVHVQSPDVGARHRKRFGKRSSTFLSAACGTVFVVCVMTVYLFTTTSQPLEVEIKNTGVTADAAMKTNTATAVTATASTAAPSTAPPPSTSTPVTAITATPLPPTKKVETTETAKQTTTTTATATATVVAAGSTTTQPTASTTLIPAPVTPKKYVNIFDRQDTRTARPEPIFEDVMKQYETGEYEPEEPERVPGLKITRRTYTPEELLQRYADTDYIYSFVNGSEVTHHYRKASLGSCVSKFREMERQVYTTGVIPPELQLAHNNNTPFCYISYLKRELKPNATAESFLQLLHKNVRPTIGDRETDELRHSIRSLEQHVQWHRGRVVIVSPGHHPTWADGAKNFLAGVCGDAAVQALRTRGTHLRLTTVHQDAIMPYGIRLTTNSHSIEQHIWRVRNTTAVHVYMNDDYFVNRDVKITDLFNEYGGTIVRTEKGLLRNGVRGPDSGGTWGQGVRNTHLFNIMELDMRHDDYLDPAVESQWIAAKEKQRVDLNEPISPVLLDDIVDVANRFQEPEWPANAKPRRYRRYATHAPFVYCTNMLRYAQTRYAGEFAYYSLIHRSRMARDLYVPFFYNAFIMARPWVASPKFLPYLLQLHRSQQQTPTEAPPSVEIALDNFDSCGQSTLRGGRGASECIYGKFLDNLTTNVEMVERIRDGNWLYFNINAGFSTVQASNQLRQFLHDKFPTPVYLEEAPPTTTADLQEAEPGEEEEKAAAPVAKADPALTSTFNALMQLPVVGVVSYEEGACPLVRSLSLAFAGHHRGRVHVAVQRHGDGAADETLREARTRLSHRIVSAMSGVKCTFNARVTSAPAMRAETVADVARRVLQTSDGAGVELPSTCGGGGGGSGGLRVRGFVIDARTPHAPVQSDAALREALAMPGQTLALEDFRAARVGPEERDVVLVLAREDAVAKAVHWITGASENDLFVTYPVPMAQYENLAVPIKWSEA